MNNSKQNKECQSYKDANDIKYHKRSVCRLCDSKGLSLAFKLTPTPMADDYVARDRLGVEQSSYPLDLFLCDDCGLLQLLDIVQANAPYPGYTHEIASSSGLVNHFKGYVEDVSKLTNLSDEVVVVDVGSNDETLIREFSSRGSKVVSVGPAKDLIPILNEHRIEYIEGSISPEVASDIKKRFGSATVVTANNFFANVDDLRTATEGISDLLHDDGLFIFESFYLKDWMDNFVFDFAYHEHMSYFSVRPLRDFFDGMGMELVDVQRVRTKGGSLRYVVKRKKDVSQGSANVSSMIESEERGGLFDKQVYQSYLESIEVRRNELSKLLNLIRSEGKRVIGYGACATATTLIYHFDLARHLDFIVDDNPQKHGKYSPGYHIPVFPSDDMYAENPDYVLILAWRFAESIIKRHSSWSENGGKFIVPLPDVKLT